MATAALTGTILNSTKEQDIVTGGRTIILTLTGDTWINSPIGVSWNESTDAYARTGSAVTQATGQTMAAQYLPIQRNMKRCLVDDAGTVNYYLSATDSTKKADNVTASDLTGADGQVMVEIPKFWYKHTYAGTTHTWEVSAVAATGFDVHPAFLSGATEYDHIYVGAYEAVLWDSDGPAYIDYASGQTITPANDKLSSVYNKRPVSNFTRASGRTMAANRGTGWSQILWDYVSAVQLLYLTEYASFNTQTMIGNGICNVTDWASISYYPFAPTGNSNVIGNASGNTAGASAGYASEDDKYMSYRGIENWYGHVWKWVDGINTNNNRSYVNNVLANLADDTSTGYVDIGVNNINSDGYAASLLNIARGFLPASVGASSSTKLTDYYYQNTGWRVAASGGRADDGAGDGGFYLSLHIGSGYADADIGGRLCFRG